MRRQNSFLLLWLVCACMGRRSPALGQLSSTIKMEDLEGNRRREPSSRRKLRKGQALLLLPLELRWSKKSGVLPLPLSTQSVPGARLPAQVCLCQGGRRSLRTPMAAQLSPGSTGRRKEVNTGLPSSFRKETGQQQGNGAWQKRGCLLSEMGQWLVEICQKYYREKYRVITFSIAPRILRWQNIFNDCFCLVESIISW